MHGVCVYKGLTKMRLIDNMSGFKGRLLLSTALTAAVFIPVSETAAQTVVNNKQSVSGVIQGRYVLNGGTWTGTGGTIIGIKDVHGVPGSDTFENGLYQISAGGLSIQGSDTRIDFDGGVIWDYSAYVPSFPSGASGKLYSGETVYPTQITGDLTVNNGTFTGAIDIRKGAKQSILTGVDKDGNEIEYTVRSKGDLSISGGTFFFSKDSQFKMYDTNEGTLYMTGGNWYVGYDIGSDGGKGAATAGVTTTVDAGGGNNLYLRGGKYDIAEGSVLKLTGWEGTMETASASYEFSGKGTLSVGFSNGFAIRSDVKWDDGTLNQSTGSLTIAKQVAVNAFTQSSQGTLSILDGGVLSVASDVKMDGNLTGKGTLKLTGTANGTIGGLKEFGTIVVGEGTLTFARGNDTEKAALDYLVGAVGDGKIGTIRIDGQTYAGTVTLNNSVLKLTSELITDVLDMGRGDIVFTKGASGVTNGRLTLKGETTIWNDSRIITEPTPEYADATSGVLTAKDGTVLTFADAEGSDENTHFESNELTVSVENGASMVSNAKQVSFDTLKMTKGSATVESGALNVKTVVLGDGTANTGTLTVNDGGTVNVKSALTADLGAKVEINGVLNVAQLVAKGQKDGVSTISGSGTLNITYSADLKGKIDGLAYLNVTGTSARTAKATFGGEYSDRIGEMNVTYGEVLLKKEGTLTIDSLQLDHGKILLDNEKSVLALRQSPGEDGGISGEGNSISGKGTLELLNNASIKFSGGTAGNVGYLGGLKIGQGTATITGDTTLGSVSFSADVGGVLQIDKDATLTLSDADGKCTRADKCSIVTKVGNVVRGEGTLHLVNGDGSTFYGIVDLGRLTLDSGVTRTISFNSSAESKIGILDANYDSNIVVGGVLTIGRINGDATIFGNGTLTVNGQEDGKFVTTGKGELKNLHIGGDLAVKDAQIGNITFDKADSGLKVVGTTTVTGNITAGAGNVVSGATLVLNGGTGTFNSTLDKLNKLVVKNATLNVMSDTQAGETGGGLSLDGGATVNVGTGKTLTVIGTLGNNGDDNIITGAGSLTLKDGVSVDAVLNKIGNVGITGSSTAKINKTADITGNLTVGSTSSLLFNGGTVGGTLDVDGAMTVAGDTTVTNVVNGGAIGINADTVFTVTGDIDTGASFKGTNLSSVLRLAGNATGTLNLNSGAGFAGTIQIGHGTLTVNTTDPVGAIEFIDDQGGVLNIAKELTVGSIKTAGSNQITGIGTLSINGSGSEFRAAISNLGTLKMKGSASDAKFYNNILIDTLAFENGGSVILNEGMAMTVTNLTQSGSVGSVYGNGAFIAGTGDVALSTGGNYLASATIGSGVMNFVGNSSIGTLRYSSQTGTINIKSGVTVSVGSDFSGIGVLKGDADANLVLKGNANAVFDNAEQFKGNISADAGSLTFRSTTDLTTLNLNTATAKFLYGAKINTANIADGLAEFKDVADVETVNILGTGGVHFKKAADIEALHVGSGYATFDAASTVGVGDVNAGGVLNLGTSHLTVDNGSFSFNDNSALSLRISRDATDADGKVLSDGYGRISLKGGQLNIYNNVKLNLTVDYGLNTAKDGSVFTIIDGTVGQGEFVVSNNRYDFKAETCGAGRCYRLTQTATGGDVVEKEQGNKNQISTAQAFLDADLFDPGTKIFQVAEHLDALSQKNETARSYLNALTALAPDVTGAMTRQQIAVHSKISNTLSARLNGLMGTMGSSSRTYRDIQRMYGRSGGSPYSSRFMRAEDYYRRAGYYDQDDRPVTRPRPAYQRRIEPDSAEAVENRAERKRWAKKKATYSRPKNFGLWAQGYYNTAEYLSANKPEGFSGDTTGFAIGADVELLDVFAVGIGYASTSASVDSLQRDTDVTGDSFFLYGMYKPSDWFVSGVLNMTSMSYDEQKDISGMTLTDKYDGSSIGMNVMVGKDLKTWTPAVGLRYVSADRDAHQDEIGQNVPSVSVSTLSLAAEARWKRDFARSGDSLWHGEFSAGMTYDLSSSGESAAVSLPNGATYTVEGDEFNALGVELGGVIAYMVGEHVDISAGYNLEWRQDYLSHTLTAMFRYSF